MWDDIVNKFKTNNPSISLFFNIMKNEESLNMINFEKSQLQLYVKEFYINNLEDDFFNIVDNYNTFFNNLTFEQFEKCNHLNCSAEIDFFKNLYESGLINFELYQKIILYMNFLE